MVDVYLHGAKEAPPMLQSVVELVKALTWPAVVTGFGWHFRAEIRDLLSKISSISVGNVVSQFDRGLKEVEELSAIAEASDQPIFDNTRQAIDDSSKDQDKKFQTQERRSSPAESTRRLSYEDWLKKDASEYASAPGSSPSEKIINAWSRTERVLSELANRAGIPSELPALEKIEALRGMGIIDDVYRNLLRAQMTLRNLAASGGVFSDFQAKQFIEQLDQHRPQLVGYIDRFDSAARK